MGLKIGKFPNLFGKMANECALGHVRIAPLAEPSLSGLQVQSRGEASNAADQMDD